MESPMATPAPATFWFNTIVVAVVDATNVPTGMAEALFRSATAIPGMTVAGTAAKVRVGLPAAVAALTATLVEPRKDTAKGFVMGTGVFLGPWVPAATAPTIAISPNDRVAGTKRS